MDRCKLYHKASSPAQKVLEMQQMAVKSGRGLSLTFQV